MRNTIDRALSVLGLMTRIPLPSPREADFSRAVLWIPLAGYGPAVLLFGGALLLLPLTGPTAAAIILLAVQYAAFNLFHYDGLLDAADALAYHAAPERRLAIMRDRQLGSFDHFTGTLYLIARTAALAGLLTWLSGLTGIERIGGAVLIACAPLAGRLAAAWIPLVMRPARPEGLGALMAGRRLRDFPAALVLCLLPCLILIALPAWWPRLLLWFGADAAGLTVALLFRRRVGGYTGDALGLAVELGELASHVLLLGALRWFTG